MEFRYGTFSCAVDIFTSGPDVVVRFYNQEREHQEPEIVNLVVVDPGYGYLCLKFKGNAGLLSGFLDERFFSEDELIHQAIEFVESLSPRSKSAYIPHHVDRVKPTTFVEYNGEY